jgi:AcrR family transcriptional regulator
VPERRNRIPNASRGRRAAAGAGGNGSDKPGSGRTVRGRRTRGQLVTAARKVFEREGFLQARISDICEAAGVAYGTFYTYFASKEEIFTEVVDSVEVDLLTMDPAPGDADPIERIRLANRHYLEAYRKNAKLMAVIRQVSSFDPEVRETRAQRQTELAHAIEIRIRGLQEAGLADRDIDPAYAAQALGGMVALFAEHLFTEKTSFDPDTAVEQLTRLWANALGIK